MKTISAGSPITMNGGRCWEFTDRGTVYHLESLNGNDKVTLWAKGDLDTQGTGVVRERMGESWTWLASRFTQGQGAQLTAEEFRYDFFVSGTIRHGAIQVGMIRNHPQSA